MKDVERILLAHAQRYPKMMPQDVVKLLYQRCFGPRHLHANPDRPTVIRYLETELPLVTSQKRVIEDIGNGYVRVYLDAIVDGVVDPDRLIDAFVSSMQEDHPEANQRFVEALDLVTSLAKDNRMPFSKKEWDAFRTEYLLEGVRPVHHSALYKERYIPHYRVVAQALLRE
jgi:hypothetical protein